MAQPTASFTVAEQALALGGDNGSVAFQLTGTFSGTVTFEGTIDGTNWVATQVFPVGSSTGATTATAAGIWRMNATGLKSCRARCSTYTSGTVVVTANTSQTIL